MGRLCYVFRAVCLCTRLLLTVTEEREQSKIFAVHETRAARYTTVLSLLSIKWIVSLRKRGLRLGTALVGRRVRLAWRMENDEDFREV